MKFIMLQFCIRNARYTTRNSRVACNSNHWSTTRAGDLLAFGLFVLRLNSLREPVTSNTGDDVKKVWRAYGWQNQQR